MPRKLSFPVVFTKPNLNLAADSQAIAPPVSATLATPFANTGIVQLPTTMVSSPDEKYLYLCNGAGQIARFTIATGTLTALSAAASPAYSGYMAISPDGRYIYATTFTDGRVVRIDTQSTYASAIIAGSGVAGQADGIGTAATFTNPRSVCISADGSTLFVVSSAAIRRIDLSTNNVTTLVPATGNNGYNGYTLFQIVTDGVYLYAGAKKQYYDGVAFQQGGRIYRIKISTGIVEAIAGEGVIPTRAGPLMTARFGQPQGLAIDTARKLLIAVTAECTLLGIDLANNYVSVLAGVENSASMTDGTGSTARLTTSTADVQKIGADYYLADRISLRVRKAVINF